MLLARVRIVYSTPITNTYTHEITHLRDVLHVLNLKRKINPDQECIILILLSSLRSELSETVRNIYAKTESTETKSTFEMRSLIWEQRCGII